MKINKVFALSLLVGILTPSMVACSSNSQSSGTTYLRVLNSEDYIYVYEPENGYTEKDLIEQFADYIAEDPELKAKYGRVEVIYDTADTMENIYSEMQTGKTNYDLICASDYIVAKMARYGLISPVDKSLIPNYFGDDDEGIVARASKALTTRLDNITTTPIRGEYKDQEQSLGDYAVGYMWGTLGILFNPSYGVYESRGLEFDEIIEDMASFDSLWDNKYRNTISIKDSMRDTFAIGLMEAYKDSYKDKEGNEHEGFAKLAEKYYQDSTRSYTAEQYNADFDKIFNYVTSDEANAQDVINDVVKELNSLKKNIFGLEVDSGKQDIVTGKIGINIAWSGDAVYSMDQAEDPEQVTEVNELYYSIPETGSNIWMDCWVTPKLPESKQSQNQWDLAHEFLNYLCDPEIASKNMDYSGYTSFIAGDSIIELVRDWYDYRTDVVYYVDEEEVYHDIYAIDNSVTEPTAETLEDENLAHLVDYPDAVSTTHDYSIDTWNLFYVIEDEESEEIALEPYMEEESQLTFGDIELVDTNEDVEAVDLSYFFKDTLDEYGDDDMIFYSDCYTVYANEYQEEGGIREICVGRQFYTQYPDENTIVRCAVMQDYEDNNELIMRMWENFKSDPLPTWAIILFALLVAAIGGGLGFFFLSKYLNKKLRKQRIAEEQKEQ